MRTIERVIILLATHAIVQADVRSRTGPWLIDLQYRHITATLIFNAEYSTENTPEAGHPGALLEGTGWWCVPSGTAVEIASFLAGWMIGRAEGPPGPSPADRQPGPAHDRAAGNRNGNTLHASEWFSLSAFSQGQHLARRGPDD